MVYVAHILTWLVRQSLPQQRARLLARLFQFLPLPSLPSTLCPVASVACCCDLSTLSTVHQPKHANDRQRLAASNSHSPCLLKVPGHCLCFSLLLTRSARVSGLIPCSPVPLVSCDRSEPICQWVNSAPHTPRTLTCARTFTYSWQSAPVAW